MIGKSCYAKKRALRQIYKSEKEALRQNFELAKKGKRQNFVRIGIRRFKQKSVGIDDFKRRKIGNYVFRIAQGKVQDITKI